MLVINIFGASISCKARSLANQASRYTKFMSLFCLCTLAVGVTFSSCLALGRKRQQCLHTSNERSILKYTLHPRNLLVYPDEILPLTTIMKPIFRIQFLVKPRQTLHSFQNILFALQTPHVELTITNALFNISSNMFHH